ncbi:MAG: 2-dehydropantoate 2-reductase [Candidatus Thermoplasmatota archaeon]|nr:2-dehydropantoate 2-reductase [Candidatus Thermoplasmatota archaeon]
MRIAVLGAGSIGCLVAAKLVESGQDVIVHAKGEHGAILAVNGLKVAGQWDFSVGRDDWTVSLDEAGLHPDLQESCDLAIITCKSKDTLALAEIARYICSGSVLSLQNGLGNLEILEDEIGPHRIAGGTTTNAVFRSGFGEINWAGRGELIIGGRCAEVFVELLSELGAIFTDDLNRSIWEKVLLNVAINPLAAICGISNGGLLESELLSQSESTMLEAAVVARTEGVKISDDQELIDKLHSVLVATSNNKCSMLQDVKAGRETEIEMLCGEVVRRGERYGIPTPLNALLLSQINALR